MSHSMQAWARTSEDGCPRPSGHDEPAGACRVGAGDRDAGRTVEPCGDAVTHSRGAGPHAPRWLSDLVDQVMAAYREPPADRPRELAGYLQACPAWTKAWGHRRPPRIVTWTPTPTQIVARRWPIAELHDHAALAALLDVDQGELAWFADVRSLEQRCPEPLRHYRWTTLPRPHGCGWLPRPNRG